MSPDSNFAKSKNLWINSITSSVFVCTFSSNICCSSLYIGIRLIDDYLAKSCIDAPKTFEEAIAIISNQAIKYYLGLDNNDVKYELIKSDNSITDNNQQYEYKIEIKENPFNDYVELPDKFKGLWYSNMICGVIRGALEAINIKVECKYNKDTLKGHDTNEIRVKLIEIIEEKLQEEEQ